MNYAQIIQLVIALLPGAIQIAEAGASSGLSGADKKAAVVAAVTQETQVLSAEFPQYAAMIQLAIGAIGPMIDGLVLVYNLIGKFTHKAKA